MTRMKEIQVITRAAWRKWLSQHHNKESGVWLVFHRKGTGQATLDYEDAVEEALCFGWIDSVIKRLDESRYARKMTPRKPGSFWSPLNKQRAERMIAQGRMTAPGLARVREAKKSGLWQKSARPDISLEIPEELERALARNTKARTFFNQLAPSYRKHYIGWIAVAQRPETRKKRVQESVALLAQGKKLGLK